MRWIGIALAALSFSGCAWAPEGRIYCRHTCRMESWSYHARYHYGRDSWRWERYGPSGCEEEHR